MKVLLVHDFLDETGGAERIVHATKLLLEESGNSVRLYAPEIQGSLANRLFSLHHYFTIRREIRRFKPDIMHVHGIYRNVSPSVLLAALQMKVPVVMTLHDFQIVCPKTSLVDEKLLSCVDGFGPRCFYSNCYPRKPFNRIYQGLKTLKLSLHRCIIRKTVRHFFSPSACLMDWTRKNFGARSISLLPNFISAEHELSTKTLQKNALIFIGTLTEQKGVDVLIKAIAKVQDIIPDVRLKIIGEGPEEQKLKKLSEHLNMVDHIAFAGKMSYQQVMREYDDALCIVIPSKYVENCSLVGIEALSKGKVIIASRIGGLPDLVDEHKTGFLVRPDDIDDLSSKIVYALQNHFLIPEMGAHARAKYERCFSKQAYARALLSVYHEVTQGRL